MESTGVYATKEEARELQELADEAQRTPVITLAANQPSFAERAWERAERRCHGLALAHGLPEIEGYYGMNAEGEFLEP